MAETNNSLTDLIKFFGCENRPVGPAEFRSFWNSLTEEEKNYYKSAPID